jgi:hypothetical protein
VSPCPTVDFSAASASPLVWFARTVGSLLREITLMEFAIPPRKCLKVHISPTRTGEVRSHHQHMEVEGILTTGRCPVPGRDRLRHCCHHLSAMQPSARCRTPWLRWTVLVRCPLRDEDSGGTGTLTVPRIAVRIVTAFRRRPGCLFVRFVVTEIG